MPELNASARRALQLHPEPARVVLAEVDDSTSVRPLVDGHGIQRVITAHQLAVVRCQN